MLKYINLIRQLVYIGVLAVSRSNADIFSKELMMLLFIISETRNYIDICNTGKTVGLKQVGKQASKHTCNRVGICLYSLNDDFFQILFQAPFLYISYKSMRHTTCNVFRWVWYVSSLWCPTAYCVCVCVLQLDWGGGVRAGVYSTNMTFTFKDEFKTFVRLYCMFIV